MAAEHIAGEEGAAASEKVSMNRKEKRKAAKRQKRKQTRREAAAKAREEEEARMNDPEELARFRLMEEEEAQRAERERMEFEERERLWIEIMEVKMKKAAAAEEEEEEKRKVLKEAERAKDKDEIESDEDGKWEYVEEGPAEIIWQGNEIIVKKKRVKVRRNDLEQESGKQDTKRPTSNPLPPQSEAFGDYKNASVVSTQQVFDNVAQQIPNFGTEQDKDHCPFHFKTGACRFGQRCSRVHFYPDRSCTLLIKNMYNGPGLAWEQDEGLEYTEEEVERCYEEFYEDVHTEFLKFGEIVNFKVCRNGSIHLRGNVYVHYKSLDSAVLAYNSINARYFAGKQVSCEFVGVTRWKVAICGEFMKSRMKTCSRGTACNFIHCFRNPGGDYEWADWDKAAPKFWVKKMVALFGFSDAYDREPEQDRSRQVGSSNRTMAADTDRNHSRRSRSRDVDYSNHSDFSIFRDENHFWKSSSRSRSDGRMQKSVDEKANLVHYEFDDNKDGHHNYTRKSSNLSDDEHCIDEFDFSKDQLEKDERRGKQDTRHSSRSRDRSQKTYSCRGDEDRDRDRDSGSSGKHLKWNAGDQLEKDERRGKQDTRHSSRSRDRSQETYSCRGDEDRDRDRDSGSSGKHLKWNDGDQLEKDERRGKQDTRHSSRSRDRSQETYSRRGDEDGDKDRDSGSSRKHLKWNDGRFDDLNDQDKNKKSEVSREIYSFRGHRDRNGGSSRKRSIWYDEKLYDPDDHWDKNRIDESNSDWSDGDRYHGHVRKSSRYQEKESGYSGGHCDEKNRGTDSTDDADRADREWGDEQKRRRSRNRSRNRY